MKVLWAVVCQSSVIDRDTNSVSLFNILEEVQVPEPPQVDDASPMPAAAVNFELFILFTRSDAAAGERGPGRVSVRFPPGSPREKFPPEPPFVFDIDLTAAQQHRIRIRFPVLPIGGPGMHHFAIEVAADAENWRRVFDVPLMVSYSL